MASSTGYQERRGIDPFGSVFISYRASDGHEAAAGLAWILRATGIPVWHDDSDLPPGDTKRRLHEALASGLSGGLLVVTPEIRRSSVVRQVEVPKLIDLAEHTEFSLAIANLIQRPDGNPDLDAPDRLLPAPRSWRHLWRRTKRLRGLKQYRAATDEDRQALGRELARARMARYRITGSQVLTLHIQTRTVPSATVVERGLVVRLCPPSLPRRRPPATIWSAYAAFLQHLPQLVAEAGTKRVRVDGGAHLSVACALGVALPTTCSVDVEIADRNGDIWYGSSDADAQAIAVEETALRQGQGIGVFVDLVPGSPPNTAWQDTVEDGRERWSAWVRIGLAHDANLEPAVGGRVVVAVSEAIRRLAGKAATNHVDLYLRCPFPVAILLGRTLNTLELRLYELEEGTTPVTFRPVVVTASGRGGSPIIEICDTSEV